MPISLAEINNLLQNQSVANYAALPAANTVPNKLYYCIASQGTKWLPGSLGGTYYPSGWYYSNGIAWSYQETPFQASQIDVDAGIITDQFVSPATLNAYSKWATKLDTTAITQTITNGVTDKAPSEDAVFDALALKADINKGVTVIYRDFTISAALTGTTAITLINSALIPANTVDVNDEVEVFCKALRNTTTGNAFHYLYYNTSASLSGATLLASSLPAGASYFGFARRLFVKSASDTETINTSGSASTDVFNGSQITSMSNLNIDWTSNVYIIQAFANAANGDSTTSRGIIIKRSRL